jgi:prepilin-type N-terminal cleavage/methylation domain-containing protein
MTNKYTTRTKGFTLVELSIVIIIIGFLIAGIAAGQSLIKQAALNSVISDMQNFQLAYNTFTQRYSAVPGDLKNADSYFTNCGAIANWCEGDGDGLISLANDAPSETNSAWRELALANMISAGIQQIAPLGTEIIGVTVPGSKINGTAYTMVGAGHNLGTGGVSSPWNDDQTNAVFLAAPENGGRGLGKPALKPEEAYNIDQKMDDGVIDTGGNFNGATTGNIRSKNGSSGGTCTTGIGYNLAVTTIACVTGLALN